jgi:hypothetical protein
MNDNSQHDIDKPAANTRIGKRQGATLKAIGIGIKIVIWSGISRFQYGF